jgi:glycosyltransferase involved in cell wall biosynthesis
MQFIFVHTEAHGIINLQRLHDGTERGAGSIARCRILFWLAARGHEVYLVGNIEDQTVAGVHGKFVANDVANAIFDTVQNKETLVVFNNFPDLKGWGEMKRLKSKGVHLAVWAGNPFVPSEWMTRLNKGELDRIVCVSKTHQSWYRIYRGFPKVEASYSGIDTDLLADAKERPREERTVLSVSMPRKTKGFHNLLSAWRIIRKHVPDARLRVCGSARMHDSDAALGVTGILDRELEEEFPDFFSDYPASASRAGIELLGSIDMTDVYTEIKSAAVAVVNCNWRDSVETYCRAAVEAQFAGTPVVGANRGSLEEVVNNGETGVMIDREDPEELADAIVQLLTNRSCRLRMGEAGVTWARRFAEYDTIAPDWEGIAARAATGNAAPVDPGLGGDLLRVIGYGYLRMAARWAKESLSNARN